MKSWQIATSLLTITTLSLAMRPVFASSTNLPDFSKVENPLEVCKINYIGSEDHFVTETFLLSTATIFVYALPPVYVGMPDFSRIDPIVTCKDISIGNDTQVAENISDDSWKSHDISDVNSGFQLHKDNAMIKPELNPSD